MSLTPRAAGKLMLYPRHIKPIPVAGIHFLLFSRGCGLYLRAPGFDKTISLGDFLTVKRGILFSLAELAVEHDPHLEQQHDPSLSDLVVALSPRPHGCLP